MKLGVIFQISKTQLTSKLKQSSIAALGVTFGIGTFIIMVSFMTGLNRLLDGLILNRTPHVHLYNEITPSELQAVDLFEPFDNAINVVHNVKPKQSQSRIHNALPIISYLKDQEEVKGVTPQVKAQVFYLAGSIQINGFINGIDVTEEVRLFNLQDYITQGEPEALTLNDEGILLGAGIAKKMSLSVGDRIQVANAQGDRTFLKVVGIFQSGMADIDNVQSYANLKMVQRILGEGESYITDINVKMYNMEDAIPMAKETAKLFNITATDIQTANAQFETGTSIRNLITYAVSIALLIVAGFGIYNILNMLIYEKMNDIAILKAIGFSGYDIKLIFISQALLIGLVGGILGLVVGYGVSVLIDHTPFETEALPTVKTYPIIYDPIYYIIGIIFAMIATFLAGYLPATRAEHVDPVEIIRGQ